MRHKWLLVTVLVLGASLLLAAAFFATFERKEITEPVAASGAARYNRFLALEKTLQQMDVPVASLATLEPGKLRLGSGDTLVLGVDPFQINAAEARRLAAWVEGGGHLVMSSGAVHAPLFEELGLLAPGRGRHACRLVSTDDAGDGKDGALLCGDRFKLGEVVAEDIDVSIGDEQDGYLFARVWVGDGMVSMLVNLDMLSRNGLKHAAARQFTRRLLAPGLEQGTVHLVYALDDTSFLTWLLHHGWPALLSLGLLLAAWMAMRSARLGPLMPAPALHRRALLEHVQAAGEFLYRRDSGRSLHGLACQAVLARLYRRDPACSMLSGDALHDRLAQRSGMDAARIARAFLPPVNAQAFRTSIITLARLGSRS